ncbi:isochorismatase family protein [Pseudovibrio denitrificans]|uniref:isochorismatase family protein n=1 Tax=Pseudovibrio denitrificans TaxID=258256 RepID=UPI000ABA7478
MVLILVLGVLLALAALAAYTFWGVLKIQTPTNGPSIKSEDRRGTALLIIDVQADFTKETGSRKWDPEYLQSRLDQINALAELAKQKSWPIIAIRHVYQVGTPTFWSACWEEGWERKALLASRWIPASQQSRIWILRSPKVMPLASRNSQHF